MSDKTDFVALYEELGLDAECSMDDFKRAYRRRVSQLHPDHTGRGSDMPRLQRLNHMYETALEFHQAYGRLPGAASPRPQTAAGARAAAIDARETDASESEAPMAGFMHRRRYLVLLALFALLLYWMGVQRSSSPTLDPAGPGDEVAPGLLAPQAPRLALGMDQAQARRILGEPDDEHAARWDYGPSWVEFQCGKVAGWYSSPLRPLRVGEQDAHATATPQC